MSISWHTWCNLQLPLISANSPRTMREKLFKGWRGGSSNVLFLEAILVFLKKSWNFFLFCIYVSYSAVVINKESIAISKKELKFKVKLKYLRLFILAAFFIVQFYLIKRTLCNIEPIRVLCARGRNFIKKLICLQIINIEI